MSIRLNIRLLLGLAVLSCFPAMPAHASVCGGFLQPACPAVPMTPQNGAGQVYGINYLGLGILDLPQNGMPRSTILGKLRDSKATFVRTQISWSLAEPEKPGVGQAHSYITATSDAEYADLQAAGIKQVMIIMGTPYWALKSQDQGSGTGRCPNSYYGCFSPPNVDDPGIKAAWQAWVTYVVQHYPNLAAIEIWNEPNSTGYWGTVQDPALYARILASAADAAHSVRPGLPVLLGGLAVQNPDTHKTYLQAIYDQLNYLYPGNGGTKFDALAVHLYPCREGNYQLLLNQWIGDARDVRDNPVNHDLSTKPIWVTETGIGSNNNGGNCGESFNEAEQQLGLALTLDWAKQQNATYHDVPVVILHTLINPSARGLLNFPNSGAEEEFGLVAWAKNLLTGAVSTLNKPAFATVSCKFNGTC